MSLFGQLSLILVIVLGVSTVMRILRQPLIIGYILSGILAGPLFLNFVQDNQAILTFSEIGIALLLFIIGLHLSPKVIKEVGRISLITGIGQIVLTSLVGYFIAKGFGFDWVTSLYIAIAMTFSSTIVIMKLLSDKEALDKLYGKISIGFLLVQDFVAILMLVVVSSLSNDASASTYLAASLFKGSIAILVLIPLSYYVFPKLSGFFAKSQEFLFLFAMAWGLGFAYLTAYAGFSIEVGALIAGVSLSLSSYSYEISSKLKPLRDFFLISFFLVLGSQMVFSSISNLIAPIIAFSLFVLIGNPVIVMTLMGAFGYSKRNSFMAGLTVAQISEFSLVLIALGVKTGHISAEILSFATLVGLITIAGSTYMIVYADAIYKKIETYLSIFEHTKGHYPETRHIAYEYVLIGYDRIGHSILETLTKISERLLVVDFNPEIIQALKSKDIDSIYADVNDADFLDSPIMAKAKVIISTLIDKEPNLLILKKFKSLHNKPVIIVIASQASEAIKLYEAGADYVVLPHFIAGEQVSELIEKAKTSHSDYRQAKERELKALMKKVAKDSEHPVFAHIEQGGA